MCYLEIVYVIVLDFQVNKLKVDKVKRV